MKKQFYTIFAEGEFIGRHWSYGVKINSANQMIICETNSYQLAMLRFEQAQTHFEKVELFSGKDLGMLLKTTEKGAINEND